MNAFQDIIGKRITNVQRIDSGDNYEFYSPIGLVLTLEQFDGKLVLSISNDGLSVDIKTWRDADIEKEFGPDNYESVLNDLKPEDELNRFANQKITGLRVAEFKRPEILGSDFVIKQGQVAGIEIKTETNKLLFQNNYGGWVDIDHEMAELPNEERWEWK